MPALDRPCLAVPTTEHLTEPAANRVSRIPFQQQAFPVTPTRRRLFENYHVPVVVSVDQGRNVRRGKSPGRLQGGGFGENPASGGEPLVLHTQSSQRLLDNQPLFPVMNRENDVADSSAKSRRGGAVGISCFKQPSAHEIWNDGSFI